MAALTIGTNFQDYSKYDPSCSVIQVSGAVDTAHLGQTCTVKLSRKDSYGTLATHVLPNIAASFSTTFDLNGQEMQDADGYNRAIQGDFEVTATLTDNTTASTDLTVSICSVNELRNTWLYGITTLSSEIILPRIQPRTIPVKFTQMSPAFVKDVYDLVYNPTPLPNLSFANGPSVIINPNTGLQNVILLDERQADWAQVQVDTFKLPSEQTIETLIIDQAQLQDSDFIKMARLATAWLETKLGFFVEPHLCVSHKLKGDYPSWEKEFDGSSFYDDFNNSTGVFPDISLPLQWLLKVKELVGYYNQQKVLTVPDVWIQVGPNAQGNIELVPTSGQASALVWQSFPFAFASMQTRVIPAFWQWAVLAGLPDLHGEKEMIRELIAKKAGIDLALMAATAYKAGISSQSTSRDSVSIATSFTASAMYSTFAHLTLPWTDYLKENVPVARRRFGGLPLTTVV